jgi:adenylylsulfate kinase
MRKAKTIWLFGLPCSGKTTIAKKLTSNMNEHYPTIHLDGDVVRKTICKEFGFSAIDRTNNLIRVADMCEILNDQGVSTVCSFVTPLKGQRELLKAYIKFIEMIYIDCPLGVCAERDVKGMYAKAKTGEIKNFTGISAPFDFPTRVKRVLSNYLTVDECVNLVADHCQLYDTNFEI